MKIKIIDLLNKIANGEEAPKKIKCGNVELEYNEGCEDYYCYYGGGLFEHKFSNCKNFLNDDVEIIEEDKKIEKITVREKNLGFPNGEWTARNMDKAFAIKINELIDEINNLKEK